MSTDIQKLFEKLENIKISECSGTIERRMTRMQTEQCFCQFLCGLSEMITEECLSLAIFNELWGWYCGGIEDGVWQYFEHGVKEELIDDTAEVLKKYGCNEISEQYKNAGKELIPLMSGELPYEEADLINEISERYGSYIENHADEICTAMKNYLLDNKSVICEAFGDKDFLIHEDGSMHNSKSGFDFTDILNNPFLSEEQRADIAATFAGFNEMLSEHNIGND